MYESCLLCISHVFYVWDMSPMYESCLLCMSHVFYVWVMSPMYESFLLYMSHVSYVWVMSPMYESCLLCMSHVSYTQYWLLAVHLSYVKYEFVWDVERVLLCIKINLPHIKRNLLMLAYLRYAKVLKKRPPTLLTANEKRPIHRKQQMTRDC